MCHVFVFLENVYFFDVVDVNDNYFFPYKKREANLVAENKITQVIFLPIFITFPKYGYISSV